MKFRFHRGHLADSMATVVEFATRRDLQRIILSEFRGIPLFPRNAEIEIRPYGFDKRINWDTHIVVVPGWGPVGFTDGPVD